MHLGSLDIADQKARLVNKIDAAHELAFRTFCKSRPEKLSFYVPDSALNYLIPRRLLELDGIDPSSVRLISSRTTSSLGITISTNQDLESLDCEISHHQNKVAHVRNFYTSNEMTGQGVTMEFYERLERLLKAIGFDYIVGENNPDNVTYFIEKLRRQLLHLLSEDEQTKLLGFKCPNQETTYKKLR